MPRGRPKGVKCPDLLKEAIGHAGNQSRLAAALGVTRQSISNWKSDKMRPSKPSYKKLSRFVARRTPR